MPPGEDDESFMSKEEFDDRMENDPEFVRALMESYEAVLALPPSPENETLQALARKALDATRHSAALHRSQQCILEVRDALGRPEELATVQSIRRLTALLEEAMDHMLDVNEPHRTRMMAQLLALREHVNGLLKLI